MSGPSCFRSSEQFDSGAKRFCQTLDIPRRSLLDFNNRIIVPVAQWIEQAPSKRRAGGSNPLRDMYIGGPGGSQSAAPPGAAGKTDCEGQ